MKKNHYTTISVHKTTLDLLDTIVFFTGLSKNEIILMILNRLCREKRGFKPRHYIQVQYQRDDPGNYSPLYIKLPVDAYEFFNDIRHIFRKSSSFQIAIALREYYDLLISGGMDDAVFLPHDFLGFFINGIQVWVQIWGKVNRSQEEFDSYQKQIE